MDLEDQSSVERQIEPELEHLKEDDETEGQNHNANINNNEQNEDQVDDDDDEKPPLTPVTPDAMKEKVEVVEENYYVDPVEDPYKKAITYLEAHNILQLFQVVTASLVSQRPQDPIQFMINEVDRLKTEKKFEAVVVKESK